jgi:hypothetical protein
MCFDNVPKITDGSAGLDKSDGQVQGLTGRLNQPYRFWVSGGPWTDIVGLVKICVVTFVVDGNVEVQNVTVQENTLIRDTVANHLIW